MGCGLLWIWVERRVGIWEQGGSVRAGGGGARSFSCHQSSP